MKFNDYTELAISLNTSKKLEKTPEGFLHGRCCVTCSGVFRYLASELGIPSNSPAVFVLRPIEEVRKTYLQLANKVITRLHPKEDVSPENSKELAVGYTGSVVYEEDGNCFVDVTITDFDVIKEIEEKKLVAFSCGYTAELTKSSGVWHGIEYDYVQSNFKYNHIALVPEGRAGDGVRIPFGDGFKKGIKNMKKIIHDGFVIELEDSAANAFEAIQKQNKKFADEIKAKDSAIAKAEAERDAAKAEVEVLSAKLNDTAAFNERVKQGIALLDTARDFGVESLDASERDLKIACVNKQFSDAALDFKDKSDDYVDAFFKSSILLKEKTKIADAKKSTSVNGSKKEMSLEEIKNKCFADGCGIKQIKED